MKCGVLSRGLLVAFSIGLAAPAAAVHIPTEVKLDGLRPPEARAHALWSLRAALNVAALQCQFSPFLATVRNYNDFLRQHGDEVAGAMKTMTGYFRRTAGPGAAQNRFDQYTTRSYQSYAAFDSQRAFCDEAGDAGRRVLRLRKGQLGVEAPATVAALRTSIIPVADNLVLTVDRNWVSVPQVDAPRRR